MNVEVRGTVGAGPHPALCFRAGSLASCLSMPGPQFSGDVSISSLTVTVLEL